MSMENEYYTYAYLTTSRQVYYIGMGCGDRAYKPHPHMDVCMPDRELIIILKRGLTQEQAWNHEEYMIAVLGRTCDGGTLVNKTKGGKGWGGGCPATAERKARIGNANRGRTLTAEHKRKLSLAKKGKKQSAQAIRNRVAGIRRPISITKDGEVLHFKSVGECAKFLGVDQSNVSNLRLGKALTCKGYSLHFI